MRLPPRGRSHHEVSSFGLAKSLLSTTASILGSGSTSFRYSRLWVFRSPNGEPDSASASDRRPIPRGSRCSATASPTADSGGGGSRAAQECGANDLSWSTRSESQAGGYILVMAKAKSGITCVLPAALPTVAFGSDGTEAGPVEQAVGKQITLSKGTVAYAGVNPKTTNTDGGKALDSIIVAVGNEDPNPVSLKVGTITVDKPVVTNWHTAPKDAVPFN
ncbi:DUF4232 domain-containing protein [Streptomyces cyaneofuscatus]|nr:DUF4232 domain-containing protein [Streptomyces cyaneofuscatus]WRO11946.1 DUF4232 domain-containing protein [Streptomyces cyaneofuscatus]